jgi:NTE family protein
MSEKSCLVLDSGAIKGIYIIGALKYLEELGKLHKYTHYVGSSVGALLCLLLVLGYNTTELDKMVLETDFQKLVMDNWMRIPYNLLMNNGLNTGDRLIKWVGDVLEKHNYSKNITFSELFEHTGKCLVMTGTSISSRQTFYFNHLTFPNTKVLEALRISISIPLFFTTKDYVIEDKSHTFVDGAVLMKYPFYYVNVCEKVGRYIRTYEEIYDSKIDPTIHCKTTGILLVDEANKNHKQLYTGFTKVSNIRSYIMALLNCVYTGLERYIVEDPFDSTIETFWNNSICIQPLESIIDSTAKFDVTKDQKLEMMKHGYHCAKEQYSI